MLAAEGVVGAAQPPDGVGGADRPSAVVAAPAVEPAAGGEANGVAASNDAGTSSAVGEVGKEPAESTEGDAGPRPGGLLTKEEMQERLGGLAAAGLDAAEQEKVGDLWRRAVEFAALTDEQQAKLAQNQRRLGNVPIRVQERRVLLGETLPPWEAPPHDAPTSDLEARLLDLEKSFAEKQQAQVELKAEPKDRSLRLTQIPEEGAQGQRQLRETNEAIEELPLAESDTPALAAQRQFLLHQQRFLATLTASLDAEEQYYKAGGEALQLLLDLRSRELTALEEQLAAWRDALKRSRESEAGAHKEQAEAAARQADAQQNPWLRKLAARNVELADEARLRAAELTQAADELSAIQTQVARLREKYDEIRKRVEAAGMSAESGALLREKQAALPDVRTLKRRSADRRQAESLTLFRQFEFSDQRLELSDIDRAVQQGVRDSGGNARPEELRELLESRRGLLDRLIKYYDDYAAVLHELGVAEAELLATTDQYADFIAQRVLWIRSCDPPQSTHLLAAIDAARWAFSPVNWREAGQALVAAVRSRPVEASAWAIGLASLAVVQRSARRSLRLIGEQAAKRTCSQFAPTLRAVGHTLVITLLWPGVLYAFGRFLDNPQAPSEFVRALGGAVKLAAVCLWATESVRQLCRIGGLADAHFEWSAGALAQIRRLARWLNAIGLPLAALAAGMEIQQDPRDFAALWSASLGRFAFIALMGLLTLLLYRLLVARSSPYRKQLALRAASGSLPLQRIWRPMLACSPLALAGLAVAGYYYTAIQGAWRFSQAIGMLAGVGVLGDLVRRWLLVHQRGLAREQARQRRAQLLAAQEAEGQSATTPEIAEETIDLAALGEQTLKLVGVFLTLLSVAGLFVIMQRLLPALQFIGSLPILPAVTSLTWGQILLFLLAVYFTFVAARDLPALVELTLLKRLPFDPAARYALNSVSRYVLVTAGVSLACTSIGITWSQVQWLVAAMGVGLGFGLQEIFANFVSGVILLFEQPIRVGDVVTIGDKTGSVSRIRIRATTLVDWDRKEYVIPNKDLVTGSLLNWTLSDHVNRIVIKIGVAFGTDTEQACRLLKEAAREQPLIMTDPEPTATFEGFGENALDLTLRCFLPSLENRLDTVHRLHTAIDRKFANAGIEIPFPHRDVFLHPGPQLPTGLLAGAASAAQAAPRSSTLSGFSAPPGPASVPRCTDELPRS